MPRDRPRREGIARSLGIGVNPLLRFRGRRGFDALATLLRYPARGFRSMPAAISKALNTDPLGVTNCLTGGNKINCGLTSSLRFLCRCGENLESIII